MDYLKIFETIKKEVENHPFLELTTFKINKGLPNIEESKKELYKGSGYWENVEMLPIFEFYQQCDGLTLKYKISSDLDGAAYLDFFEQFPDVKQPLDKGMEIGSINILPFKEVFIYEQEFFNKSDETAEDDSFIHFGDYVYEGNSFGQLLFVFDLFSDTNCMAFVPDEDNQEPKIIQLLDYYIVWNSSRITFFESYIKFLAVTRGLIGSKDILLDYYAEHKNDPLIFHEFPFGTAVEPSLFKENLK